MMIVKLKNYNSKHINLFIQLQHEEDRQELDDSQGSYSEEDVDRDGGE